MKHWKACALALGFVLLVGATSIPAQLWFKSALTGGVLRKMGDKAADIVSLCDFETPCPAVSDDTPAIVLAEASAAGEILLPSGTYNVNGATVDPLKKKYIGPGIIKIDGITRFGNSVARGRELALDYVTKIKSLGLRTDKPSMITRLDANTLFAYRPMGGPFWQEIELKNTGVACTVNCPYAWDQTRIAQYMSYIALEPVAALVHTGTWATTLNSGNADLYIGGHAKQSQTVTDKVDLTFSGDGDLYVIWAGRTSGTFVKVQVDGSDANANALPIGGAGSYHYIDTYTSVDLQYKQTTKVATNLASGSHTLTLTVMVDKNAGNVSGLNSFLFNGVAMVSKSQGLPLQTNTRTPQWVTGTTYITDDWVFNAGKYYFATGGGVAGASAPTCGSGTCSDGTVTWQWSARSSYDLTSHIIQAAGSQLEYGFYHKPTGASSFAECGLLVHGNEILTTLNVDVDGQQIGTIPQGAWISGDTINVVQAINSLHPQTGATVIANTQLIHRVTSEAITVQHTRTWLVADTMSWYYTAMWPLFNWGSVEMRYAMDNLFSPQYGKVLASSYYGQNNPIVGDAQDFYIQASGGVLQPKGAANLPSSILPTMTAVAGLYVTPESVNEYRQAGALYAALAMNLSNITPPSVSSNVLKMYFERTPTNSNVTTAIGDTWSSHAVYYLQLVPTYPFDPTVLMY